MSQSLSPSAAEPVLLTQIHPAGYAVLTLNRPHALNALSRELRTALARAVDGLIANPDIQVLILTGAGRAFCAGLDLKELGAGAASLGGAPMEDPVNALSRFSGPIIGAINGAAVTGGFELALACDILLATPNARFADTHSRIGVAPGWGLSQKLSRAVGIYRAREISLSARWVSAEQAAAWGLVNQVLPADELLPRARALAVDMLGAVPGMLASYKATINDGFALSFGDGMALEGERALAYNRGVSADDVQARREGVRQRNQQG